MFKKVFGRILSVLLGGRDRRKIHIIHTNGLFGLIPDDVWMLIVNEWLDHVKVLTSLEIAMGKENMSKWIYALYHRLSIPITLNATTYPSFKSWKEHRGLQSVEHIIQNERSLLSPLPWKEFTGLKRLQIQSNYHVWGSRHINLVSLLTMLPELEELSIGMHYLIEDEEQVVQAQQKLSAPSALKSLKLLNELDVSRSRWKKVLKLIAETLPNLETFHIENADTCPLRYFFDTLLALRKLVKWTLISNFVRRRHNAIDFDLLDEEELEELRHVSLSVPTASTLPSLTPATTYTWEHVHLQLNDGKVFLQQHQCRFLSMLFKCKQLQTLHIDAEIYFPRTFPPLGLPSQLEYQEITALHNWPDTIDDCPWSSLHVLELTHTLIFNDMMSSLIRCCGNHLTKLSVVDVPYPPDHPRVRRRVYDSDDEDHDDGESDIMRTIHTEWIGLLKDHCPVLQTLTLGIFPYTHECDILLHLLSSSNNTNDGSPVYATALKNFKLHFYNMRLFNDPSLFHRMLSPFQRLHSIQILVDEKEFCTDCVSLLFTCFNASLLETFHFQFTHDRQTHLYRRSFAREYQWQLQSMLQSSKANEKSFPNLISLTMINCLVIEEALQFILLHSNRLETVYFRSSILSKKTVILPHVEAISLSTASANAMDTPSSLPMHPIPEEGQHAKIFEKKELYYTFGSTITINNSKALRALLSPPHIQKFGASMRRGGIYSIDSNSESPPHFKVQVSHIQMQHERLKNERQTVDAKFWNNKKRSGLDEDEEIDEAIEEELLRGGGTEEVFVEYVSLSLDEELRIEKEYFRRKAIREDQIRLDAEDHMRYTKLPLKEWILRMQQRSRRVYVATVNEDGDNP
jgi:hypothetical protein